MYALTVFIRNLGNFVRLKQALFAWIDENLIFCAGHRRHRSYDAESYKSHDPGILELIDFLRSNRKVDSQCSDTSTRFEEAVNEFLEMFNGSSDLQQPCHRCTQTCFPSTPETLRLPTNSSPKMRFRVNLSPSRVNAGSAGPE